MPRFFIGLDLPLAIKQQLLLLPRPITGARWQTAEQLHLTLKFIGDLDNNRISELIETLAGIDVLEIELEINGVDYIGSKHYPRILLAKVKPNPELSKLHKQIHQRLENLGLELKKQKFCPHITLARLNQTPYPAIIEFLQTEALLKTEPFLINSFHLYRSKLLPTGSKYQIEASFSKI